MAKATWRLLDDSRIVMQVLLVDRPGLKQTTIAMGEPGVQLRDADAPALDVLTSVLNNFGGRLFNQIRSREVRTQ